MTNLIEPPFNYTGSKFKLLEQLLPLFDYYKTNFVDLFAGGGSVYTNIVDKYDTILINDIIEDLIGIHKKIIYDKDNTVDLVKALCVNKQNKDGYHLLRDSYNNSPTPEKLYALMLCCTNNMLRFNKSMKFNQTFGKRTFNKNTELKINTWSDFLQNYKNKLTFSSKSFKDVEVMPNTFYYIDPPYLQTEAGYNALWSSSDDVGLFNYCVKINEIGSTFAVSGVEIHDGARCRLIDLLVENGYNKTYIEADYNKVSRKGTKITKEVLVTNYASMVNSSEIFR